MHSAEMSVWEIFGFFLEVSCRIMINRWFWPLFCAGYKWIIFRWCLLFFQFDWSIEPSLSLLLPTSRAVSWGEVCWILANVAGQAGLLLLLRYMWITSQRMIRPENAVELGILVEKLLPRLGLLRGAHSLYLLLRPQRNATKGLGGRHAVPSARIILASSLAVLLVMGLAQTFGTRALRLLTLALPLLYVDTADTIMSQVGSSMNYDNWKFLRTPAIIHGYHEKPLLAYAAQFLFYAMLFCTSAPAWKRRVFILISPLCSALLIFRFLLVRHTPEYRVDPIPIQATSFIPSSPFCQVCHSTILTQLKADFNPESGSFNSREQTPHHWTTKSLRNAAVAGCRFCATVWHNLSSKKPVLHSHFMFWRHATWFQFELDRILIFDIWMIKLGTFRIWKPEEDSAMPSLPQKALQDHTGSESSLRQAKVWYLNCRRGHPACHADTDAHFRPSRLVYLGDHQRIRLHTNKEYPEGLTYMTLSHCWGEGQLTRLQKNNEEAFRQAISWDSLPQTFMDAIRVARSLGSEYLWIDSLCIVQDSLEDWCRESATMRDVYRNSMCNIAASSAANSHEGCLYPRNPRFLEPARLPWPSAASDDFYLINGAGLEASYPLYTRAWVLQEALLAPRTIDCGKTQLFWRCDALTASEELPGGLPTTMINYSSHPTQEILPHSTVESLRSMAEKMKKWEAGTHSSMSESGPLTIEAFFREGTRDMSPREFWCTVVELYSRM